MTAVAAGQAVDPRRYFESVDSKRSQRAERLPVCVYLETTNRCNLLCTTCPRTYAELEPPADMSWALFTSIVDQIPHLERAVLHGVGEPMLVKNLPKMVRYLKDRGTYVLFNTNGTVLNDRNGRALIDAGLDVHRLPAWYDVDDSQALRQLHAELFDGGALDPALTPFRAHNTAFLMDDLMVTSDLRTRLGLSRKAERLAS